MTVTDPIGNPTTDPIDGGEELGLRIFDLTAEPWMSSAACRGLDPALFFPERGDGAATVRAKAVCARCPVLDDCAAYAATIANPAPGCGLPGVWAGESEKDRKAHPADRSPRHRRQLRPSRPDLDYPAPPDDPEPISAPIAVGATGLHRFRWPCPDVTGSDGWPRHTWADSTTFAPGRTWLAS